MPGRPSLRWSAVSGFAGAGGAWPFELDFDWDVSEDQALTHGFSTYEVGSAHQHAWITNRTRLGTGHAERFEIHNDTGTDLTGTMRSLMNAFDTNDGGAAGAGVAAGPSDVYWCWSSYLPTSGAADPDATVIPTFSQTTTPDYEHLFELHDREGYYLPDQLGEVTAHAIMLRNTELQFRGRCGTWTWNGSGYNAPSWNTTTPGTSGSNDQIPIPIVKPGSTDATYPMNVWVDIIFHVRFATNSTGLIEIWARQAGQSFTASPNLTINGPTHRTVVCSDAVTRTSETAVTSEGVTGLYLECGLYNGDTVWNDGVGNGAHVHIMDELRRKGSEAAAKANWG